MSLTCYQLFFRSRLEVNVMLHLIECTFGCKHNVGEIQVNLFLVK